jgi:hypothetical protein
MQATEGWIQNAVYRYNHSALSEKLVGCITRYVSAETWTWLQEKAALIKSNSNQQNFMIAFGAMPRKTGKQAIMLSEAEIAEIQNIRQHFYIQHWTIDRLCRVWLLMQLDTTDETVYVGHIERLFPTAEMSELVALYSALPVLAYPELWRGRCAEGIRNNIADVLEAIMCNNPYPSENLDEAAWNQLVLKAIFTGKPIHKIVGLDARANQTLANTLSDYAHERWAAHRPVHPLLWRCVGKFITENIFPDIMRIALSVESSEREAAALVCAQSTYPPAVELLQKNGKLKAVLQGGVTWQILAEKLERES